MHPFVSITGNDILNFMEAVKRMQEIKDFITTGSYLVIYMKFGDSWKFS